MVGVVLDCLFAVCYIDVLIVGLAGEIRILYLVCVFFLDPSMLLHHVFDERFSKTPVCPQTKSRMPYSFEMCSLHVSTTLALRFWLLAAAKCVV